MPRKRTKSSVKASCDRLWSQLVKTLANYQCERCGASPEAQKGFHSHHIYGRGNHRLRYEPRNGVALCYPCHRVAEESPIEFVEWLCENRAEDYAWLKDENAKGLLSRSLDDYLELEQHLQELLEGVQEGGERVVEGASRG